MKTCSKCGKSFPDDINIFAFKTHERTCTDTAAPSASLSSLPEPTGPAVTVPTIRSGHVRDRESQLGMGIAAASSTPTPTPAVSIPVPTITYPRVHSVLDDIAIVFDLLNSDESCVYACGLVRHEDVPKLLLSCNNSIDGLYLGVDLEAKTITASVTYTNISPCQFVWNASTHVVVPEAIDCATDPLVFRARSFARIWELCTSKSLPSIYPVSKKDEVLGVKAALLGGNVQFLPGWGGKEPHAEMQIFAFLANSSAYVPLVNYLGISKTCCVLCAKFIEAYNSTLPISGRFQTLGAHSHVFKNWRLPSIFVGGDVEVEFRRRCTEAGVRVDAFVTRCVDHNSKSHSCSKRYVLNHQGPYTVGDNTAQRRRRSIGSGLEAVTGDNV